MSQTKTQLVEGLNINTSAPADALAVDNNGRVGVGTTTPGSILHIRKDSSNNTPLSNDWPAVQSGLFVDNQQTGTTGAFSAVTLRAYNSDSVAQAASIIAQSVGGSGFSPSLLFTQRTGSGVNTERMRIDSSGRVGIGTSSPDYKLHVSGANAEIGLTDTNVTDATWRLLAQTGNTTKLFRIYDSSNAADRFVINASGNVGIGTTSPTSLGTNVTTVEVQGAATTRSGGIRLSSSDSSQKGAFYIYDGAAVLGTETSHPLGFYVGNTPRATIDTSGRLLVGTSSSTSFAGWGNPQVQVRAANSSQASLGLIHSESNNNVHALLFGKIRGTGIVHGQDELGRISWQGYDGSTFRQCAEIMAVVDGTPGASDMPGRLVFSTTADGAAVPTERLRIASTGAFGLSGANYGTSGQVLTSQGSGSAPQWATPASAVTTTNVPNLASPAVSDVTVTGIPAAATNIVIALTNVQVTNTGTPQLNLQMGNGSLNTADYYWTTGYGTAFQSGGATSTIRLASTDFNNPANAWSGIIHISESNGRMAVTAQFGVQGAALTMAVTGATWAGGGTIDRIRIFSQAGNFTNGRMSVHSW